MVPSRILLASNSPRRQQLLTMSGVQFRVRAAVVDERPIPPETPAAYVLRLAESKARAAATLAEAGEWILAADTTVADGGWIMGKPSGAEEATDMLMRLRGKEHEVHTAIAVFNPRDETLALDVCTTRVPMRNYSAQEVQAYVASGDPLDKAGAYAIQHPQFRPVEWLAGCYASVMGLPLCHLARTLEKVGIALQPGIPQACQEYLNYACPIFSAVLRGENVG